ncbi:MAG TPA: NifU family protein [Acidimicrobiia bacterium]|jgi:Fe/S biogenesis protein NfuA
MTEPVLTITDAARAKILEVRAGEDEPETLALFVEIAGQQDGAFTYTMELRPLAEAGDADVVQRHDDLSVVIAGDNADDLRGATLDLGGGGMVMQNPNRPPQPSVEAPWSPDADTELVSDVARTVIAVLEEQINPAIAAHGGRADLVAVEEPVAYLVLSGGCQGCGLASVTLSQGIEVAIVDAVPEIETVVDVTDHASGVNPYFESAKK